GGPDHLVADAIAQLGLVQLEGHPALDVAYARLGQHIGHRVAHAQVGRDRAVENAAEHREHVGGGAADVHAHHVHAVALGQRLDDEAHGAWRGHDGHVGPGHELAVARRLRHDVLHE